MATDAAIAAAILAAQTLGVTPAGMVALIDQKIAELYVEAGTVTSYSAEGRSITKGIQDALKAREFYQKLTGGSAPVTAVAEFVSG
jgi:hypothetical protein